MIFVKKQLTALLLFTSLICSAQAFKKVRPEINTNQNKSEKIALTPELLAADPLQQTSKKVFLQGNIGAGKSTLLKIMAKELGVIAVPEPLSKMKHSEDKKSNLLDLFYKDPARWAYMFQSHVLNLFMQNQYEQQEKRNIGRVEIYESSIYSNYYCFARNCYKSKLLTQAEWEVFTAMFNWFLEHSLDKPNGFIYLRTDPQKTAKGRINLRGRPEEAEIPVEYLKTLHDEHENFLVKKEEVHGSLIKTPVLVLDYDENLDEKGIIEKHIPKIRSFLETL